MLLRRCEVQTLLDAAKDILSSAQVPNDERSAVAFDLMAAGVPALLRLCYPGVYQVGQPDGEWGRPSASSPG